MIENDLGQIRFMFIYFDRGIGDLQFMPNLDYLVLGFVVILVLFMLNLGILGGLVIICWLGFRNELLCVSKWD